MHVFFCFENVAASNKETNDKSLEFLSYLNVRWFEYFYATFTKDGFLKDNGNEIKNVGRALVS